MKEEKFFSLVIKYIALKKKIIFIFLFFVAIAAFAVFGKKGILQRYGLEVENRELKEKLKREQEKTILLEREINDIKNSDKKIEKIAREKYGMIREGEGIYRVVLDTAK